MFYTIYKIECIETKKVYISSTNQTLSEYVKYMEEMRAYTIDELTKKHLGAYYGLKYEEKEYIDYGDECDFLGSKVYDGYDETDDFDKKKDFIAKVKNVKSHFRNTKIIISECNYVATILDTIEGYNDEESIGKILRKFRKYQGQENLLKME